MTDDNLSKPISISDEKLKILWKQSVTASLFPDNNHPAYKIYYILLKKEIIENYINSQSKDE